MSRPVKAVRTDFFCQAEHKTPTPSEVGVLCSATGSGHVITCTARRWVVSGRLYCFQRPPAEGRREACKPSTDPTSRITNVRINRAAAHRSKIFSASFPPCLRQAGLPSAGRKILPKEGEGVLFRRGCVKGGVPRLRARVTFGRSPKSDQKVCLKPKVSRLPARYAV